LSPVSRYVPLAVLAAITALVLLAKLRYSGKGPLRLLAASCNTDLWKHVGEPEKLRVIEAYAAIEGRVGSGRRAADGDPISEILH
jgi:hypothetical protein